MFIYNTYVCVWSWNPQHINQSLKTINIDGNLVWFLIYGFETNCDILIWIPNAYKETVQ